MSSAPAKLILCGEHAVVYGRPAIAIPLSDLRATVTSEPAEAGRGLTIVAPDLGAGGQLEASSPLLELARRTLEQLGCPQPDATLTIQSAIPVSSGMGSGAAVAAALVRELAALAGQTLEPATISELVYDSERHYHGTPSGIDNTVVSYEQPVLFIRDPRPPSVPMIERLEVGGPWTFVIADTGIASRTKTVVGELRERWAANQAYYNAIFDDIGRVAVQIYKGIKTSDAQAFGMLLTENHRYLTTLGVSSAELEYLIEAAHNAGARGAKLSGAGKGGVMLALVDAPRSAAVSAALLEAGARQVWTTTLARTMHA